MRPFMKFLSYSLAVFSCPSFAVDISNELPKGAYGILIVEQVTKGALPFLQGIKGNGTYLTRNQDNQWCKIESVPFLAGGFTGRGIGIEQGQTIQMTIYNSQLSDRLKQGLKVISADYQVSSAEALPPEDIQINQGLSLEEGFIFHPRKAWSNWFSEPPIQPVCQPLSAMASYLQKRK